MPTSSLTSWSRQFRAKVRNSTLVPVTLPLMALLFLSCGDAAGPAPVVPDGGVGFGLPFVVGTTWTYNFTEAYHEKDYYYRTQKGVHVWRLTGVDGTGIPRTYSFTSEAVDTAHISQRTGPNGALQEATYVYRVDVPFTATVSNDSITFRWSRSLGYVSYEAERLARAADNGAASVTVAGTSGGALAYSAVYERGIGLRSFQQSLSAMSASYSVSLTFVSVKIP